MLAFMVERDFDWSDIAFSSSATLVSGEAPQETEVENSTSCGVILPILDSCGMTLALG